MRNTFFLLGALVLATAGHAQNLDAPGQVKKTDPVSVTPAVADLATIRTNVEDAKNLAKDNHLAQAEQKLTALNVAKADTADWHMETAQRLMQTAEQLARDGQPDNVAALAASALTHLTQAGTLAKDAESRAAAKTLTGFIQERYLADPVAARTSYEAAAQLSPDKATAAKEAAERLKKADDNLKDKIAKGGK